MLLKDHQIFCISSWGHGLEDKQEGAQWFASAATIRSILEACLSRVSTLKGQALLVQHMTMYDGVFEKAKS